MRPGAHNSAWDASVSEERLERGRIASVTFLTTQRLLPDALVVGVILRDFGWDIVDVGGIESCRYFEAMCMVWVIAAMRTNNWDQAFKLLRT